MTMEKTDLLVIGAGPAGISAALYARRGGLSVTVVTKGIETGGLSKAEKIENYYGFAEPISGKELLRRGAAGARRLGVEIVEEELLALSFNDRRLQGCFPSARVGGIGRRSRCRCFAPHAADTGDSRIRGQGCELLRHLRCLLLPRQESRRHRFGRVRRA